MPANYVLLERIELNASAASVTFSNIPQSGYTDLKVVYSVRTTGGSGEWMNLSLSFNGLTTNWSNKYLYGTGSAAGSNGTSTNFYAAGVGNPNTTTANTFSNGELYVPNYLSTNAKSVSYDTVTENNGTSALVQFGASLWNVTGSGSIINSVTIAPESGVGNFAQYSTFSLYGLAAVGTTPAIAPFASGGNIQTDGTYWYHTFLSSGTFTPAKALSCDVLVVAGGGGSGGRGGGGGAGGLYYSSANSLPSNTAQTVTIGAGGAGGASDTNGNQGSNSQFGSLTAAVGGGYGGGLTTGRTGGSGGSGGGGGSGGPGQAGGSGTSYQGNTGGNGTGDNATYAYGGGGGGAGAVGTNGATSTSGSSGSGGVGSSAYSSWGLATSTGQNVSGTYYYAGGGAGGYYQNGGSSGSGGYGGGGGNITAGTANTGGGGGSGRWGSDNYLTGYAGGSGVTIIRYLAS